MAQKSRAPDPVDAELARLLAQHHGDEAREVREHLRECPCCSAMARMIACLRSDLWAIAERQK
jgi:predicted anti-sigma-YlaC factor YlaD